MIELKGERARDKRDEKMEQPHGQPNRTEPSNHTNNKFYFFFRSFARFITQISEQQ